MRILHYLQTIMPLLSPVPHRPDNEYDTPRRKVIWLDRYNHFMTYDAISDTRHVLKTSVYDIYNATSSRRSVYNPKLEEKRGKKSKVSPENIRQMERILEDNGFYARALTWE